MLFRSAAIAALNGPQDIVRERCAIFEARRNALVPLIAAIPGLACDSPHGAFYLYVSCAGWIGRRTPQGKVLETDADATSYLLENGVALPNGAGYGLSPYFRISFATGLPVLEEASRRIDAAARKLR